MVTSVIRSHQPVVHCAIRIRGPSLFAFFKVSTCFFCGSHLVTLFKHKLSGCWVLRICRGLSGFWAWVGRFFQLSFQRRHLLTFLFEYVFVGRFVFARFVFFVCFRSSIHFGFCLFKSILGSVVLFSLCIPPFHDFTPLTHSNVVQLFAGMFEIGVGY